MQILKMFLLGMIISIGLAHATDVSDYKTVTSKAYVDREIAGKQPILNETEQDLRNNVVMYTNQAGVVDSKPIIDHLNATGTETQANINTNLPTVGAVNNGLGGKQNTIGQNKTAGNVVTYTNTAGTLDEHAVYKSNTTYNANGLIEAQHANSAIQKGLNEHLSCAGNMPNTNVCWLWNIEEQSNDTVYTPHTGD